jgi:heme/copper-type cytochrome/quinol oxidase subunit 3
MRNALTRLGIIPFQTAIAILLVISGLISLTGYGDTDPFSLLLPVWEVVALAVSSVLSGVAVLAGLALPHRGSESAGLILLVAVILSRFLLYGQLLGYGPSFIVTGVFDSVLIWASLIRLGTIARRRVIVLVAGGQE